jgi:hypothetical protein
MTPSRTVATHWLRRQNTNQTRHAYSSSPSNGGRSAADKEGEAPDRLWPLGYTRTKFSCSSSASSPHIVLSQWPSNLSALARKGPEAMYSLRYSMVLVTLMACVAFTAVGSSRNSQMESRSAAHPSLQ